MRMEQQRKMGFLTADKPGDQGERMNTEKKIRKKKTESERERDEERRHQALSKAPLWFCVLLLLAFALASGGAFCQ